MLRQSRAANIALLISWTFILIGDVYFTAASFHSMSRLTVGTSVLLFFGALGWIRIAISELRIGEQ